jgi:predicted O-linked N-acetylglucosamine transferase (SPINDLY family)
MPQLTIQQALDLAVQHHRAARLSEAENLYRQILAQQPGNVDAMHFLGVIAHQVGHNDAAVELIARAISLKPNFPEAYVNLGLARRDLGQIDEAIADYQKAIALRPNYADSLNNLGNALKDAGQLDKAIAAYRQAILLKPNYAQAHSNLLFALHYHPAYDAAAIANEHRQWNIQHAEPLSRSIQPHLNNRDPRRRIRIGYVSPDFRAHCQSMFTVPLLSHHDHGQFEIYCYSGITRPDEVTARLTGFADVWRGVTGMPDAQLAELIRADGIDILVDLTMHMSGARPLLFARKPAPVQVAWLAYPGTTGLAAMDYRLTDPYLDPPGEGDAYYTERSIRLPDAFWCYDPLTSVPGVNDLPALGGGGVTFGCLNNFCKVNDGTLALWAKVLRRMENSRLLLLSPAGNHRQPTLDRLRQESIDPARVEFVPHQPRGQYLATYHRIDLGLDTFPYNGHTTTLDSFWMGVPVVTMIGDRAVARAGWCQLSNLGLQELVGKTPDEFVEIAVNLADDLPRLAQLRSSLRRRMEQSPLMDARKFARNVEAAYRSMWQVWCDSAH